METLSIGNVYTFNTNAPGILGAIIKNATLTAQFDYETASAFEPIDLKYRTIYPLLPAGAINSARSCTYYRFQTEANEKIILADQWIDMATVEIVTYINYQVTFRRSSMSEMTIVRNALNALGLTNYDMKQI